MGRLAPARAGVRVREAGGGAAAGLLCLSARVENLSLTGLEIGPETAELARANIALSERADTRIVMGDIGQAERPFAPSHRSDHGFANRPWHRDDATASPLPRRDKARRAIEETFPTWVRSLSRLLKEKGSLTLAIPAERLAETLVACAKNRIASTDIAPFWPHAGEEARIILVRGRLGGRAGSRLLPGIVLHKHDGSYSDAAEAILRKGAPLYPDSFGNPPKISALPHFC